MFSRFIKLLFVTTAYAPILLIWWIVSIYNILKSGEKLQFIDFTDFQFLDLINRANLIFLFIILLIFCWYIVYLAKKQLTINNIEIKSIKSADLNMNVLVFSYFLPCIEFYKKDNIFIFGWCIVLLITILINKGTYFYNPLMKIFKFRYYEITTQNGLTFLMISQKKLINTNDVNSYSQLTDYVILNASKN